MVGVAVVVGVAVAVAVAVAVVVGVAVGVEVVVEVEVVNKFKKTKMKTIEKTESQTMRLPENDKLRAIAKAFAMDVPQLISEKEKDILEAWSECEQEAQDNETKPVFKLGFSVKLDLDANAMQTQIRFGVVRTASIDREIPDPSQPDLPTLAGDLVKEVGLANARLVVNLAQQKKKGGRK